MYKVTNIIVDIRDVEPLVLVIVNYHDSHNYTLKYIKLKNESVSFDNNGVMKFNSSCDNNIFV